MNVTLIGGLKLDKKMGNWCLKQFWTNNFDMIPARDGGTGRGPPYYSSPAQIFRPTAIPENPRALLARKGAAS